MIECSCYRCTKERVESRPLAPEEMLFGTVDQRMARMFLCAKCRHKRCPHAADHRLACTASNEPGQPGSLYENVPATPSSQTPASQNAGAEGDQVRLSATDEQGRSPDPKPKPWDEVEGVVERLRMRASRILGAKDTRTEAELLDRNRVIVDETDLLVACPGGFAEEQRSGTWATVRYARKCCRSIVIIWPDGALTSEPEGSAPTGVAAQVVPQPREAINPFENKPSQEARE